MAVDFMSVTSSVSASFHRETPLKEALVFSLDMPSSLKKEIIITNVFVVCSYNNGKRTIDASCFYVHYHPIVRHDKITFNIVPKESYILYIEICFLIHDHFNKYRNAQLH